MSETTAPKPSDIKVRKAQVNFEAPSTPPRGKTPGIASSAEYLKALREVGKP